MFDYRRTGDEFFALSIVLQLHVRPKQAIDQAGLLLLRPACRVTSASAARPTGPAATLASAPSVTFPPLENARTALSVLSTITKSVTSAPICGPQPAPPVPMNDGPDQPCPVRATTTPSPAFPLKIKPAFTTLIMANPRARRRIPDGIPFSGMCRNSRMVPAERLTVSCSVAFAAMRE